MRKQMQTVTTRSELCWITKQTDKDTRTVDYTAMVDCSKKN